MPLFFLLRAAYMFYLRRLIPLVGQALLGNPDSYRMLGAYTEAFENVKHFAGCLRAAGLDIEPVSYFLRLRNGSERHEASHGLIRNRRKAKGHSFQITLAPLHSSSLVEVCMTRLYVSALLAGVLLAIIPQASAQYRDHDQHRDHDEAREHDRYDSRYVSTLIDRVHTDLNHAYGAWHFSDADRDRLNGAQKKLREFAQKWDHGKFDKDELDDAISSIQHVLDNNKLPREDRDAISDDLSQLRAMREAHDRGELRG